jgi:hypothetical protein
MATAQSSLAASATREILMKTFILSLTLAAGALGVLPATASAQRYAPTYPYTRLYNINPTYPYTRMINNPTYPYTRFYANPGYPYSNLWGYPNYNPNVFAGYTSSFYGVTPYTGYYGPNPLTTVPHWHTNVTPYGSFNWYGLAPTDFQSQTNVFTPYGSASIYSTPYGFIQSYAP